MGEKLYTARLVATDTNGREGAYRMTQDGGGYTYSEILERVQFFYLDDGFVINSLEISEVKN